MIFRWNFFVSQSQKHFVGEPFCISENLWYRKIWWTRGGYHDFLSEGFLSHSTKKIIEEPFCVSENFWYRKNLWIRNGGYHNFLSAFLRFTIAKNLWGNPLMFQKISGIEKFMHKKVISLLSFEFFSSHSAEKVRRGSLLCFKKFCYRNFWCIGVGIIVLSNFLLSHVSKIT